MVQVPSITAQVVLHHVRHHTQLDQTVDQPGLPRTGRSGHQDTVPPAARGHLGDNGVDAVMLRPGEEPGDDQVAQHEPEREPRLWARRRRR